MKWKHDELADDLAAHLRGATDRMVWTNMQMGPSGSPRPDVYTMPKSYSKPIPMTYEVKISVSDFRSDVTSGKWQSYLAFSAGVIFAVPAGLIDKDDVPKACGLIFRHDNTWRAVKKPVLQHVELNRDHWMKLLIDGVDRCQAPEHRMRQANAYAIALTKRKELGELVAAAIQNAEGMSERAEYARKQIREWEDRERARVIKEMDRMQEAERRVIDAVCNALGIDRSISASTLITSAERIIAKRLEELNVDTRLNNAREMIERMAHFVESAKKACTVADVEEPA